MLEDPTGARILFDPGDTIRGGDDSRLGAVDAILVSHAHADHLGNVKPAQDPDSPAAPCTRVRAAEVIINQAAKAIELEDVEARVIELERAAEAAKKPR